MRRDQLIGRRFGRLIVVDDAPSSGVIKQANWMCRCDCGRQKVVAGRALKSGDTRSCGCIASERMVALNSTHGDTTDGPSAEWITWRSMHQRCYDPRHKSYKYYGARGVSVCRRWHSFEHFLADMGRRPTPRHSIDRRENGGNYEPGNCRWATASEQARNRRPRQAA